MLHEQEFPQSFELATLLFESTPQEIAPFRSFQERFQSFVDQFSSYLHSSVKDGFFTNFFLGIFSTLLDTKLNNELNIKNIFYNFDGQRNLKIAVSSEKNGIEEAKFFVFSEKTEENTSGKNLFTTGDLEKINFTKNIPEVPKKFTWVKINKDIQKSGNGSISKIKIEVNDMEIKNSNYSLVADFKKITKKLENESTLEDYIEKLYSGIEDGDEYKEEIENSFAKIMRYIKNIFDGLGLLNKSEAEHHGFVAGIFDNFRYRYNTRIYLEQFAGRGYADIILLVRGPNREICSIPILIELKAGTSGSEVTAKSALEQAKGYVYGCQLKKMRLATSAEDILCVGLNLDLQDAFETNLISIQQQESSPIIKNILNIIYKQNDLNHIKEKIEELVSKEYLSFPPTQEKSDPHYLGLFFLGQNLLLDKISMCDIKKHVYVKKTEEYSKRFTRSNPSDEIIISDNNSLISIGFMPNISNVNCRKLVLLNIVAIHKDEDALLSNYLEYDIKINTLNDLYKNSLKDKEIVDVKLTFDLRKKRYNKTPIEKFLSTSVKIFKNHNDYILDNTNLFYADPKLNPKFNINPKLIHQKNSKELMECFNKALCSQRRVNSPENFSAEDYGVLLKKIGVSVYDFKSLLRKEAHFQAVLHGIFDYYSDIKSEGKELRKLVLTEFQTGAGSRIDMMIQIIDISKNNIYKYKEYIPVGLELKYTSGTFSKDQKDELEKQMCRYTEGKAIKAITDGREIVVIGVVFFNNAPDGNSLILMYEGDDTVKFLEKHSSTTLVPKPTPSGTEPMETESNPLRQDLSSSSSDEDSNRGGGSSRTAPYLPWDGNMSFPQEPMNKWK